MLSLLKCWVDSFWTFGSHTGSNTCDELSQCIMLYCRMAWWLCLQYWERGCVGCWTSVSCSAGAFVVWIGALVFQLMNNFICGRLQRSAVIMCFSVVVNFTGGTWWLSWLRHCATSQKVMGLIPNGVIGIFHWHNPSGRTVALGLTQPLVEMSTRNISWG
jgi:hypothetical protein